MVKPVTVPSLTSMPTSRLLLYQPSTIVMAVLTPSMIQMPRPLVLESPLFDALTRVKLRPPWSPPATKMPWAPFEKELTSVTAMFMKLPTM